MCAAVVNTGDCLFSQLGPVQATLLETTDAPGAVPGTTPYAMGVGDEFLGGITAGDADVIAITLTAGQSYQFLLGGRGTTPGLDTILTLYYDDGTLIGSNDDSGGGLGSSLRFTADETGTYLLRVTTYNGMAGQYQLRATTAEPIAVATLETLSAFLTDGYWTGSGQQRHAFDTTDGTEITVNVTGLTAEGQALALAALDAWEMVANVTFRVVTQGAEITFDDTQAGAFASYVASGTQTLSAQVNVSTNWLTQYGTAIGDYSFQTYVHEIGHALGLGHQGPYNGSANFNASAIFSNDSNSLSIMSYFDQDQNPNDPSRSALLLTPMMADILAIQTLYGAPVGGATVGNTVWGEGSTLANSLGDFFRATFTGPNAMNGLALTIYDESGRDRVVFSTDTTNQSVLLEGEARWNVFGGTGNVIVARGTVIEDYTAGSGNDSITGNQAANSVIGNGGHDVLAGAGGNDTLDGGAGNDRLNGGAGNDRLIGGAGNDIYFLGDAADVVVEAIGGGTDLVQTGLSHVLAGNVENLTLTGSAVANGTGNGSANLLIGNGAANNLSGGAGNDTLNGGGGNDTLNGGADMDRLVGGAGNDTYLLNDAGDQVIEAADGGTDVVQSGLSYVLGANIEHLVLTGSAAVNGTGNTLANRLIGNSAANILSGGIGNDTLNGGAGLDRLVGGAGDDLYVLGDAIDLVFESLGGGTDTVQTGQTHVLAAHVDHLLLLGSAAVNGTGNGIANQLTGNLAANILSGGAGNDTLNGGAGNDVLTGGGDADAFVFVVGGGQDRITDFQNNVDTLQIDDQLFGPGAATWAGLAAVGQAFADRVEFHFAPTQVLTVYGVTQVAQLADDYAFI